MAFVRPYRPSDKDAMNHVFRETAHRMFRAGGESVLFVGSFIWCSSYYELSPEWCFVVDNGEADAGQTGTAVGYLVGTPDTQDFVSAYQERIVPLLAQNGIERPTEGQPISWTDDLPNAIRKEAYEPHKWLYLGMGPRLFDEYPAHMHIDILPGHQARGFGRKLIEAFVAKLRQSNVPGLHLAMATDNASAGQFYSRIGFERCPEVLDDGESGELGRDEHHVWLVMRT